MGDVVLDDLLGTGCAVTATRDMPAIDLLGTDTSRNRFRRDQDFRTILNCDGQRHPGSQ